MRFASSHKVQEKKMGKAEIEVISKSECASECSSNSYNSVFKVNHVSSCDPYKWSQSHDEIFSIPERQLNFEKCCYGILKYAYLILVIHSSNHQIKKGDLH
jgi:hypothetical protein